MNKMLLSQRFSCLVAAGYSGIHIPKNQKPQLLKSGLKIGVTHAPL